MPTYYVDPKFPTANEELGGKSWFHWCHNTHLHSRRRMYTIYNSNTDNFGRTTKYVEGWVCLSCGLREINSGGMD